MSFYGIPVSWEQADVPHSTPAFLVKKEQEMPRLCRIKIPGELAAVGFMGRCANRDPENR